MVRRICGIDEAGRGPLAGPIVAAAVVIPEGLVIEARDSKRLTERGREKWAEAFKTTATERGIQFAYYKIEVPKINAYGIGWANREVFRQLILHLDADEYIVDGNHKLTELGDKQDRYQSVIRADETNPLVSAASILAKTYRDAIMLELHKSYPQYHWNKDKGYGTQQRISAIKTFGGTPHHRGQFVGTVQAKNYGPPLLLLGPGALALLMAQLLKNML